LSPLQHQTNKGTTLVIDEFPYLVQKSPELPSIIQKLIDNRQNKTNIIMLRVFTKNDARPCP